MLLVSHWAVSSEATVRLITQAVGAISRDKKLGRAEAPASHHHGDDRQGQVARGTSGLLGTVRDGWRRCCAIAGAGRRGSCVETSVLLCN